jgi:drug/metabolite transporter (DMT)-like permease
MFSKTHNKAVLALIVANLIWGAASPVFKLALQNITPFTLAFLRFFGAMLILLPFTIDKLKIEREDILNLILLSFFGITINISFFFFGLKFAPSINAPVIGSAAPIIGYLSAIFFLHEKLKMKVLTGTLLSLLGILVIVLQPLLTEGFDGQIMGNMFFVIAMIGSVGHCLILKKILPKYSSTTITFWSFFIGQFTFFPMFVYELYKYHPFDTIDSRGINGLLFGIILSSALAYFLYDWGIKKIPVQEVGIFTYIDPLSAALIAMPLLGEFISPLFILGLLFVFGGIYLAEGRLHWHPLHRLSFREVPAD